MSEQGGKQADFRQAAGGGTASTLITRLDDTLIEAFPSMPLSRQKKIFRVSDPSVRLVLLNLADAPIQLVRSLPVVDFYWTAKELEREDRVWIIKYADMRQIQYLTDLEIWARDEIDMERFFGMVELLREAGDARLSAWLRRLDIDLIKAALGKVLKVDTHREMFHPEDDLDRLSANTLDGLFYLEFLDEKHKPHIETILKILMRDRREDYHALMETLIWLLPSEHEELAFEARQRRLTDHGFPDPEDFFAIYRPMTEAQVLSHKKEKLELEADGSPRHALARNAKTGLFLHEVLQAAHDRPGPGPDLARIGTELAHIANKIVCSAGPGPEASDLREAMARTERYVSLGLEIIAKGGLDEGARALDGLWLEHLFKLGFGKALELHDEATALRRKGWLSAMTDWKRIIGPVPSNALEALLLPQPQYFAGLGDPEDLRRRDFESTDDLVRARRVMARIRLQGMVLMSCLGMDPESVNEALAKGHPALSFGGLLLTAIALRFLGEKTLRPLNGPEVVWLRKRLLEPSGKPRDGALEDGTALLVREDGELGETSAADAGKMVSEAVEAFAREIEGLDLARPVDPSWLSTVWLTP